jgi:lipid-binding SYLF domain-containing protein
MTRLAALCALALLPLLAAPGAARAQTEQQTLVDRATLAVQELFADANSPELRSTLRRAKAVMVCPRVFKAGFILGGQGGACVLTAKTASGWSNPAFYGLGSGSIGLQIGVQDAQIVFLVLTDKGLAALMDSQFKIGADASVAVATIGAGVSGATTAALRADIVAFAQTRGLFAGVAIDGSLISQRSEWNHAYYGQTLAPQQIVLEHQGHNPGADPLRETLAHFAAR